MATLRKRGTKWQVQIRRNQAPNLSKSFLFKEDAQRWAREQEHLIDIGGLSVKPCKTENIKFSDLLARYQAEVTINKRSLVSEKSRINTILRHCISQIKSNNLMVSHISAYRDMRLKEVSGPSVRKEIALILHVLKIARHEWAVPVRADVLTGVAKPSGSRPRKRRLEPQEYDLILNQLKKCRNPLIAKVFRFALATGMRRSEILGFTWSNVDIGRRTVFLPITKNGDSRTVPLSCTAMEILAESLTLRTVKPNDLVFPVTANALRLAWERAIARIGIADLRFHDLRHEAISRFFELGLSVPEVALISGHKDPRMLFRYTHLRPTDVAEKLRNMPIPEP